MESEIKNFSTEYSNYEGNYIRVYNGGAVGEFQNLDIKMRLAFGISEIKLNNEFVSDKEGDLKKCHLLYYKLTDLWFAYETYIKLSKIKSKTTWLDTDTHNSYAKSSVITRALEIVNNNFHDTYNSQNEHSELIEYLDYCKQQADKYQKERMKKIIKNMEQNTLNLTHSETLTIIYAIRNNFVHSGETTIVPNIFGYENKSKLLNILYNYLSIVLLNATNIALSEKTGNLH